MLLQIPSPLSDPNLARLKRTVYLKVVLLLCDQVVERRRQSSGSNNLDLGHSPSLLPLLRMAPVMHDAYATL